METQSFNIFAWLLVLATSKIRSRVFDMVWEFSKIPILTLSITGKKIEKFTNSFRDVSPMGPFMEKNRNFDFPILSRDFQELLQLFAIILLVLTGFECGTFLNYSDCE